MERIILKYVYDYLHCNELISPKQSRFTPGDSTDKQLSHLYHMFAEALDNNKDVRLVFCDISKAFDRVWHKGLILKLEKIGIGSPLLNWFGYYL